MSSYGPPGGPYSGRPQEPYGEPADPWADQDQDRGWGGGSGGYDDGSAGYADRPGGPPAGVGHPGGPPGYGQPGYGPAEPYPAPPYEGSYDGYGGAADPRSGYPGDGYAGESGGYPAGDRSVSAGPGGGYGAVPHPDPGWTAPAAPGRSGGSRTVVIVVAAVLVLLVGGGVAALYLTGGDPEGGRQQAGPTSVPQAQVDGTPPATDGAEPRPQDGAAGARQAKKGQCLVNDGTGAEPQMRAVECDVEGESQVYEVLARFDGTIDYAAECAKVPGYQYHYFFDSETDTFDFVLCMRGV